MTTVLLNDDNELIITNPERIMQRSKNVNNLCFRVNEVYKKGTDSEIDMYDFKCYMEYLLPISKNYKIEELTRLETLYEGEYYQYVLPFDTGLTGEAGDVEVQLTFIADVMDATGDVTEYVRKSSVVKIPIIPISRWSDVVPDGALNTIDQKISKLELLLNELNDAAENIYADKADNIAIVPENGSDKMYLTLKSNGNEIGDKIDLDDLGEDITEVSTEGLVRVII